RCGGREGGGRPRGPAARRPPAAVRPGREGSARRARARSRACEMKVSIVGGTGDFGRALAARLRDLEFDVAVGSREHQRGWERGVELGVRGGSNEEIVKGADLIILAVRSNATLDTARELGEAIGETPVLCVASDLLFTARGRSRR